MTGFGTRADPISFADEIPEDKNEQWVLCFDYCRDRDRPFVVKVGAELAGIFPSGRAETSSI